MRVLLTTQPAVGHFHPMVPLARALVAAGHEVLVASSASFLPTVVASGLPAVPVGVDWRGEELLTAFPDLLPEMSRRGGGPDALLWAEIYMFVDTMARQMVTDVLALGHSWHPDVILRDPFAFGGAIAAEALGIPHAMAGYALLRPKEAWRERLAGPLDTIRREQGLPADPEGAMIDRYLTLAFMPPDFRDPEDDVAPTVHFLRPTPFDRSGDEGLPAWLDDLPARPTVYVTLGTIVNHFPGAFDPILAALAALADDDLNLILTVGRNVDPAGFGPQAPNAHIARYIPQTLLFPRCDLVVTHAGFNTAMSALDAGLPLLATPLGADQPKNARLLERLGVARVIQPADLAAETIRAAVLAMLADRRYREAAGRQRAAFAALPGLEEGVALLERLAAEQAPLVAVPA